MDKILSISIASYNVEAYLEECLESFVNSKVMDELEVLVIDDGSSDSSPEIAQWYADKFPDTFRLIRKENGGHGSTINKGIEVASGKYFKVVDGDDWVNTGNLIRLVEKLKTVDSDIVATNYTWINCETKLPEKRQEDPFRDLEYGREYQFDEIADRTIIDMHAMAVKTELLREMNEKIDEHTFYVDVEYILFPIPYVKTVLFLEEDVYQYRLGMPGQSMSIKKMQKNLKNHLKVLFRINDYCEKMKDKATPAQMNYMNRIVAQTLVSQMKIYISFPLDRKMKKNIIKLDSYFYHHNRDAYDKVANRAVWLLRRTNYRLYPLAVLAFRNRRNSY